VLATREAEIGEIAVQGQPFMESPINTRSYLKKMPKAKRGEWEGGSRE
jgi:hypothetical protein